MACTCARSELDTGELGRARVRSASRLLRLPAPTAE